MPESAIVEDTAAETIVRPRPKRKRKRKSKRQPPYNVILWNDDDHTFNYVIQMMRELFGHPRAKGYQIAAEVDATGRAIVLTTTLEHAELKRDQIHAYGKDRELAGCAGSMWATIEPVEA